MLWGLFLIYCLNPSHPLQGIMHSPFWPSMVENILRRSYPVAVSKRSNCVQLLMPLLAYWNLLLRKCQICLNPTNLITLLKDGAYVHRTVGNSFANMNESCEVKTRISPMNGFISGWWTSFHCRCWGCLWDWQTCAAKRLASITNNPIGNQWRNRSG